MLLSSSSSPDHLNSSGCVIKIVPGKGRGVFASCELSSQSVIEISPVLLFSKLEYEEHGKHTILDHYAFKWRDGRHALALGLGSLFNHSNTPNVSYTLDHSTESIRYTTARKIEPGEELCIFYGHNLWFDPVDQPKMTIKESDDEWGGIANIDVAEMNPDEVVPEDKLPFELLKLKVDEPEEEIESVRTIDAWVVDIPDPRQTSIVLKWIKTHNLEHPTLNHLKRVRKKDTTTTVLLSSAALHESLPPLDLNLSPPYIVSVPSYPALTVKSLQLKSALWPVVFAPSRKNDPEIWTINQVKWAEEVMHAVIAEAIKAHENGQLPIASCVPVPYEVNRTTDISFMAHDTRNSTSHPLRHSILNLTRQVGEFYEQNASDYKAEQNGSNYLLTSQTVFTTHEPCVMCSMVLLHSRVARVIYLIPMEKTGGCGGVTCLPKLESVNHRYAIGRWKDGLGNKDAVYLQVEDFIDA